MEIRTWKHAGVDPDGNVEGGGAVGVTGRFQWSAPNGGCGLGGCGCSPGFYMVIPLPRNAAGEVCGATYHFDTVEDLREFAYQMEEAVRGFDAEVDGKTLA